MPTTEQNTGNFTVKDLQHDEQPREKLQRYGAGSLSNAELLAILIRTGSEQSNVIDTSRMLLYQFGSLDKLARKDWQELRSIKGIGQVKAITLTAAFELSRRLQAGSDEPRIRMRSPEEVAAYFCPRLRDERREHFIVVFLNSAKYMSGHKTISSGGQTSTIVDPAEIMRQAIMNEANSIVVIHNHPSGNTVPSESDVNLTLRIRDAGKLMGIFLEDHLITGGYDYTSFKLEGWL